MRDVKAGGKVVLAMIGIISASAFIALVVFCVSGYQALERLHNWRPEPGRQSEAATKAGKQLGELTRQTLGAVLIAPAIKGAEYVATMARGAGVATGRMAEVEGLNGTSIRPDGLADEAPKATSAAPTKKDFRDRR